MSPLRSLRYSRNLSIDTVAKACGTNIGNLSRIERGVHRASPLLAEKLVRYFGYAVTEIHILYPERYLAGLNRDE